MNPNEPADKLTKRELLAAMEQLNDMDGDREVCESYQEAIVGRKNPNWHTSAKEAAQFEAEFRAKVRVMRADALLSELSATEFCEWALNAATGFFESKCAESKCIPVAGMKFCPYCAKPIRVKEGQ